MDEITEREPGLRRFLVEAKLRTYASGAGAQPLPDGGKELAYAAGPWRYRDRYVGFDPFAGQEIVWQGDRPVWTMGYYGGLVLGDAPAGVVPAGEVYAFLQAALRQVTLDRPYRGPDVLRAGDFEYRDVVHGDLARFTGVETIFHRDREVYRLDYHGGVVS